MPYNLVSLDSNHPILNEMLLNHGFKIDDDYHSDFETIKSKIGNYHGLILRSRVPINAALIKQASQLKFIARVGAGLENIDLNAAKEKGIAIIHAPEGNMDSLGEHNVGMLLSLLHKINASHLEIKNNIWEREANRADELGGKTVGIVGYGNMGKAFARRLSGFGVKILCYDILPDIGDAIAKQVKWKTFCEEVDVVSLHIPLTVLTKYFIDKNTINSFKKPFYLLNTARGQCVNTNDLIDALKSRKILGAALDVLEYEKSSFEHIETNDNLAFLKNAPNVILTPHIAGWSHQSKEKLAVIIANKIIDFLG